jgi:hypothetical protein
MDPIRRAAWWLGTAFLTVALVACGGSASPSPSGAASSGPSASAPASSAPSASPAASSAASAEPSSAASALPSIDVGGSLGALEGIDSYRISITSGPGTYEATVIVRPEPARAITVTSGGSTTRIVIIGQQAWLDTGGGTYSEVPAAMTTAFTSMFDPLLLLGSADSYAGGWTSVGEEEKNGVQARHLHVDGTTLGGIAGFPAGASVDVWVATDGGYLVAWETSGFPAETTIDISNVNDPANVVEAPS